MKKYFIIIILLSISFLTCNENKNVKYESKFLNRYELKQLDSLLFFNSDSIYLGQIKDVKYFNGNILITDKLLKKLWIFDNQLKLKRIIGGEGEGPGEYVNAPFILPLDTSFILVDWSKYKIDFYNKNFLFEKSRKYPSKFIFDPIYPIKVGNNLIFSASEDLMKKNNSIVILDLELNPINTLLKWEPIYQKKDPYGIYNPFVLLSNGRSNTFFARQQASLNIYHYDEKLKLKKIFGTKPKFFKDPPNKNFQEIMQSVENTAKYVSSITKFILMEYDEKNNFLFVNYVNYTEEASYNHSDLSGEHFLQIYNHNYDCIFDGEIPGKLAFVSDGKIYILTDERPEYIKFKIFRLEKN